MISNTLDFLLGGCTAGASLILLNTKNEKMNKNFKLCSTSSIGNIYSNAPLGYVAHYHRTVTDHMLAVLHSTRDVCIRLHPLGVSCVSSCHAAFLSPRLLPLLYFSMSDTYQSTTRLKHHAEIFGLPTLVCRCFTPQQCLWYNFVVSCFYIVF